MAVKNDIFDSKPERKLFIHLKTVWEKHFDIFPQLPFKQIFDMTKLNVNKQQRNFLFKTNIDYTVCDKKNKPLICIEFDGLRDGYSRDAKYIPLKKDFWREKKLDLKLKIANEHCFPFFVISYEEKKYLNEKIHLTILDGIIGQVIAGMNFQGKINEYMKNSKEILSSLNGDAETEYLQDMVTAAEVGLDLTWNPIAKKAAEIHEKLFSKKGISLASVEFVQKPELPELKSMRDYDGLKKRAEALKKVTHHGVKITCETPKGKVTETAWVRNFEGIFCSPHTLVHDIAELLAFSKAAIVNNIEI